MSANIAPQLTNLGLKEHEVKVYLALLELGKGTVTDIGKIAGINRTTGYDVLERLCLYGIASRSAADKKRVYSAEPPHRLRQFLENKKRQAERRLEDLSGLIGDLQSLYKTDLKPAIKFAHGKEEMKNIYLHVLDAKSEVYSIVNLKGYAEIFDEIGTYQTEERAKKKIKEKVLAIDSPEARAWHKKTYGGQAARRAATEYRWLKWDSRYATAGEVNIFDDNVVGMLSKPGENVAFEIRSQNFADFLKIIFEMAWMNAEKCKI